MDREELLASIVAARPDRDQLVYLERRDEQYQWRVVPPGGAVTASPSTDPDVWMTFSTAWPVDDAARMRSFFDDLLAELESMANAADRCRWPLDEPWPHVH